MITLDYLLSVHSYLENNGYCASGIRDKNLLYSAIGGQDWYDHEINKIIHVAYSICANHIFIDGNKRTAFLICSQLEALGYVFDSLEIASHILELATNSTDKAIFVERIKSCIY